MLIQKIIKESMDRDPMSLKETLAEELRSRVALALEAKMRNEAMCPYCGENTWKDGEGCENGCDKNEGLDESESSFEVGDKVRYPDDERGRNVTGTVKEVRGSGKKLVVSVDFGKGVVDLLPNSGDKMDKLVKENLDESKLPVAKIKKAVDDGKSMDVIVGMFANKRTTNTDEIRKIVKDHMWKNKMKKETVNEAAPKTGYYFWDTMDQTLYPEGGHYKTYRDIAKVDSDKFFDNPDNGEIDNSLAIGYMDDEGFWSVDRNGKKKKKLSS